MSILRSRVAASGASVLMFALATLGISELAMNRGMYVRINALQWDIFGPNESIYSWTNLALPRYVVVLLTIPMGLWVGQSSWRLVRGGARYSVRDLIIVTTMAALAVGSIVATYDEVDPIWPVIAYSISSIVASWLVLRNARRGWPRPAASTWQTRGNLLKK